MIVFWLFVADNSQEVVEIFEIFFALFQFVDIHLLTSIRFNRLGFRPNLCQLFQKSWTVLQNTELFQL